MMEPAVGYWIAPAINTEQSSSFIDDIIKRIEVITRIPLTVRSRERSVCEGRQLAAYILRVRYGMTLYSVGRILNVDHSTIVHSVKTIRTLLQIDKKFVFRWKSIIDYTELEQDLEIIEPEEELSELEIPRICGECKAFLINQRFCELRHIRCYESKRIAKECKQYHLVKI